MKKKIQKKFFVLEIISSEFVALNCLYQEENTCHRHSENTLEILHITNRDFL